MIRELTLMRVPVKTINDLRRPLMSVLHQCEVQVHDTTHPFSRHGKAGADVVACLLTHQDRLLCSNTGICRHEYADSLSGRISYTMMINPIHYLKNEVEVSIMKPAVGTRKRAAQELR